MRGVHLIITAGLEQKTMTELLPLVVVFYYNNSQEEETGSSES